MAGFLAIGGIFKLKMERYVMFSVKCILCVEVLNLGLMAHCAPPPSYLLSEQPCVVLAGVGHSGQPKVTNLNNNKTVSIVLLWSLSQNVCLSVGPPPRVAKSP